jgi:hypothetical protein
MRVLTSIAALLALALPDVAAASAACPRDAAGVRALLAGRAVLAEKKEGGFASDGFVTYAGSGEVLGIQPIEYELQTKQGQVRQLRVYLPGTNVEPFSYGFRNAHSGALCDAGECKWKKEGTPLGALNSASLSETIYKRGALTLWCFYTNDAGW